MGVLNGVQVKIIDNGTRRVNWVNLARELGMYDETTLSMTNTGAQGKNDFYISNVLEVYPEVLDILLADKTTNVDGWEGSTSYCEKENI